MTQPTIILRVGTSTLFYATLSECVEAAARYDEAGIPCTFETVNVEGRVIRFGSYSL